MTHEESSFWLSLSPAEPLAPLGLSHSLIERFLSDALFYFLSHSLAQVVVRFCPHLQVGTGDGRPNSLLFPFANRRFSLTRSGKSKSTYIGCNGAHGQLANTYIGTLFSKCHTRDTEASQK